VSASRHPILAFASLLTAVALASSAACTSSDGASPLAGRDSGSEACPNDLPAACPTSPPSYAKDVAPVIQQACTPCHAPGGEQSSRSLVTYAGAFANRSSMLDQVHACRMPPSNAPPLSAEGRTVLQTWVVCGGPDN
jgi:hypothetical protein